MDHVSYYIVLMKSKRITVSSIRTALNHAHSPFLMEVSSYKRRVVEDYLKKKYVKAAVLKTLLDTGACLPEEAVTDAMTIYLTNQRVKYNARAVIRVLDVLFEYGAILSNVGGNTHPLLYFIMNKKLAQMPILEYFLQRRANLTVTSAEGFNLLHLYLKSPYPKLNIIKLLLDNGVDINAKTRTHQYMPLHIYLMHPRLDKKVVEFLLRNGADADYGWYATPLGTLYSHCVSFKLIKKITAKLLEYGADMESLAIASGHTAIMSYLVSSHTASIRPEYVSYMIECGANINRCTSYEGYTPLILYIIRGLYIESNMILHMIDCGADPLATSGDDTILHYYLKRYVISEDIIDVLLSTGIDVNAINDQFHTPLHMYLNRPSDNVCLSIIQYMIDRGAATARLSRTIFMESLLETFLKRNRQYLKSTVDVVNYLLTIYPINEPDACGFTPLLSAIYAVNLNFFNYFIELGADVNAVSVFGDTCVTLAVATNHTYFLTAVLNHKPSEQTMRRTLEYFMDKELVTDKQYKLIGKCITYAFTLDPCMYKDFGYISVDFKRVVDVCEEDIISMKHDVLDKVSVYDLVFGKNNTMPMRYVRDYRVTRYMNSVIYGGRVKTIINNSVERDKQMRNILIALEVYCRNTLWHTLPVEIRAHIVDKLPSHEVRTLAENLTVFKREKLI
ncbi:ankyrin repeat protein [Myxoma virus]|nr:ankyrin repeat protein [Myxoma virus]AQT35487.1 ankyrin repeat protein [Myxoma virus]AQT35657.1 ankyrin repeat protein [Myxoma virus]AQT35827.1 ankyrin repeat protein [Myxoma virus]